MQSLPTPILGEVTALTITTPDLEQSLAFYQRLGFKELFRADWPFPWIQVTDGVLLIMLREDPRPYLALTYYVKKIDAVIKLIEGKGIIFTQKPQKSDAVKRALFITPDGLNISLVGIIDGFKQPTGPGMLQMQQADYFNPDKYVNKVAGMFGELAHPVADLEKSIEYWKLLGFTAVSEFASPYPWAILTDGLAVVGLHQTTNFDHPAITYFAADMAAKIAVLKAGGLKDYKEESPADIRVETPEGQHFFLYNLGGPAEKPSQKRPIQQEIIETERLLLKSLTPEMMDELFTRFNDEEISKFLGLDSEAELEAERSNWKQGLKTHRNTFKSFQMVEKSTGRIIGKLGFHNWYAMHSRSEFGYALKSETDMGKGYMKEAVRPIIEHGFEHMGLYRIEAYVGLYNTASIRLIEGLGFTKEGVLRAHFFKNGAVEDSRVYGLLKNEFHFKK